MKSPEPLRLSLSGETDIVLTRQFFAPARLVYRAWIDPTLVPRWLGKLTGWEMVECTIDARDGGAYRYLWRDPEGKEMGISGHFIELVPNQRIVTKEQFDEPWHEGDVIATVELTEENGVTTATTTLRYDSQQVRDDVIKSDVAWGVEVSYAALDELIVALG
ncbi:SRPBCC domain-containing protein [Myxococcota bacterium]|nr:SRPBCC domain-containing protein [Myxococcota bacterium]